MIWRSRARIAVVIQSSFFKAGAPGSLPRQSPPERHEAEQQGQGEHSDDRATDGLPVGVVPESRLLPGRRSEREETESGPREEAGHDSNIGFKHRLKRPPPPPGCTGGAAGFQADIPSTSPSSCSARCPP